MERTPATSQRDSESASTLCIEMSQPGDVLNFNGRLSPELEE